MNMLDTVAPKSDQMNADDLIGRTLTITVTRVAFSAGSEQPVSLYFDGDNGKPFKACKSMRRVLIHVWGADAKAYEGRSMTLYRDPEVTYGGVKTGGIRISHMSHIEKSMTMALTATKQSRKPYTVQPLKMDAPPVTQQRPRQTIREMIEALPDRVAVTKFLEPGTEAKKAFDKLDATKQQAVMDMLAEKRASFLIGPQSPPPSDDEMFPGDTPMDEASHDQGDLP